MDSVHGSDTYTPLLFPHSQSVVHLPRTGGKDGSLVATQDTVERFTEVRGVPGFGRRGQTPST